jgi:hypothetical protein
MIGTVVESDTDYRRCAFDFDSGPADYVARQYAHRGGDWYLGDQPDRRIFPASDECV